MNFMTILGFVPGVFTSIQFFPQVTKIRKEKSAKNVSFNMILSNFTGQALWLIYAFSRKDLPLMINCLCALIVNLILGWFKFKYK